MADAEDRVIADLGKTKGGKVIQLVKVAGASMRSIQFKGGGQLPECLQGAFTSVSVATTATNAYLAELEARAKSKA